VTKSMSFENRRWLYLIPAMGGILWWPASPSGYYWWPFAILSFASLAFFYLKLQLLKDSAAVIIAKGLIGSTVFWIFWQIPLTVNIYIALSRLYGSSTRALLASVAYVLFSSLKSSLFSILLAILLIRTIKSKIQIPILALILFFQAHYLYFIWPRISEAVLVETSYFAFAISHLGGTAFSILFYLQAALVGFFFVRFRLRIACICYISLVISFTICAWSLEAIQKSSQNMSSSNVTKTRFVLFQTNIDNHNPDAEFPFDWIKKSLDSINQNSIERHPTVLLFPEYSFDSADQVSQLLKITSVHPLRPEIILGISRRTTEGLANQLIHLNEKGEEISSYTKNVNFPMGEVDLNFPLIPKAWRTPSIKYYNANSFRPFVLTGGRQLFPIICYEGILQSQFDRFDPWLKNGHTKEGVFIHLSKDSHFAGTQIMKYLSLGSRLLAAGKGVPLIRVSTTGLTEVYDRFGQRIALSSPNKQEFIEVLL
jgi:apolipoprotein N-acyltransferase